MNTTLGFTFGLLAGLVSALILLRFLKRERSRTAEQQVAPQVLQLELARADRIGYAIALVLFKPPIRQYREFYKWLQGKGKDLRLRDYDLVLRWSDDEILIVLPGMTEYKPSIEIRPRFNKMLIEDGWPEVGYGITLFPLDHRTIDDLIGEARNNMQIPELGNGE